MSAVIITCLGVLVGSIPTGIVISRLLTGRDVRQAGSGNFGAANVARTSGYKVGLAVALLDMLKGALPVLIGISAGLDHQALAIVALAAVLGHDFSVFLRLKGGKGVATTLGVAIVLVPLATIIGLLLWVAIMAVSRYSSLASLASLAFLPVGALLTRSPQAYVLLLAGLFVLGAAKHWENILRLAQGKENKFQVTKPARGSTGSG